MERQFNVGLDPVEPGFGQDVWEKRILTGDFPVGILEVRTFFERTDFGFMWSHVSGTTF